MNEDWKRKLDALCDSYELEIYMLDSIISNARQILKDWEQDISNLNDQKFYDKMMKALEGEQ